ncbi:MAG: hypothetical protein AAB796_02885 [Patescibacteria group bacterium]
MGKQVGKQNYIVLTPTEDLVVQVLSKSGKELSISKISEFLKLARTSIYNATRSLMRKQLLQKKGFTYSLHNELSKKIVKDISASEQIRRSMREMLMLKKNEIIYSIESDEEIKALFNTPQELIHWQKVVAEREIVLKGIGTKNAANIFRTMASTELMKQVRKRSGAARFTNEPIKATCTLVSFRNSIIFFSRKQNFFYRIDDSDVSKFVQSVIDLLYGYLEYQQIV